MTASLPGPGLAFETRESVNARFYEASTAPPRLSIGKQC
jgi:hypothetical protein